MIVVIILMACMLTSIIYDSREKFKLERTCRQLQKNFDDIYALTIKYFDMEVKLRTKYNMIRTDKENGAKIVSINKVIQDYKEIIDVLDVAEEVRNDREENEDK